MSQHHFLFCNLSHPFFDSVSSDKSVDHDFVLLTNTMSSGQSLNIVVRIPVRVINNDCKFKKNITICLICHWNAYRTRAIIGRSRFEATLVYKPRILGLKNEEFPFLVHKLSVI